MKIQKKHIVLGTLMVALGAAVYLNWQFSENQSVSSSSKELGAAEYVNATEQKENASTYDEAVQTSNMTGEQQSYFAQAKNDRNQTQDKILDSAGKALEQDGASEEDIEDAVESIEKIIKSFTYQDSIESILKAKGFTQCLCYISDEGCTVIVLKDEMNETSALMIKDAVVSQINISFEKVTIVEV